MFHRSTITRAAGAVILGAGLMLGTAAPALASEQETGPKSQACVEATQERDGHEAQADEYQAQADEFEGAAAEHDANAAAADEVATARQAQAAAKDDLAAEQQEAAEHWDEVATDKQSIADEYSDATTAEGIAQRDAAREAAADARVKRDAARDRAEGARQAREDARASAADARTERNAQRDEATKDRERRDARLAQVEREQNRAAAVDMSVCDEPPADGTKPPPDEENPKTPECEEGQVRNDDGDCVAPLPPAEEPDKPAGGDEDKTSNVGVISDDGQWVWNGDEWVPVDTDDGDAPEGGVETGDGGNEKLAYTGAGNMLGWLAGGLGLVGAGALAMAAGPRLLRRS